ncbi:class I SAM-dependent methyltransferase [Mycobacterium celatum]|uniref:Class I SAM-dependent methyltransferase n=1 Tax=Mycobacterium celatum TaxID=28045 RepID=A0A1X1RUA0_MYCCE|nr:class I SAM-dependent methyltransferase [Mycobacterium celatum]ORV17902.1 methyltransferase type 12 [Mycobacterium celatum]PIB73418.1 class I SAM-dependent methyltransferase [Mycobacterium celatum]
MDDPALRSVDPSMLREAMARRLYRRSVASGQITLPAVPAMLDEYVTMCHNVFAGMGVEFTADQFAQLKAVLAAQLTQAYTASSRSNIVISYHAPFGTTLHYRVQAESSTIETEYDHWVTTREGPLFGTEPDARVWALAGETADPTTHPVLDIGAGTGRNALALARGGHPVDAVEISPKFAHIIRYEAERESLAVRIIERDVLASVDGLRRDYQLIVLSEVVPDFRTTQQLHAMFELAAQCLAPGGRLVFNAFLPRHDYTPDDAARELGQQCNTMIFTRDEMTAAAAPLPLELDSDDSAGEYEKAHLPQGAWPPTGWYDNWANGLDLFDVAPQESPVELRWLVYRRRQ